MYKNAMHYLIYQLKLFILLQITSSPCFAVIDPIKHISQLEKPEQEEVVSVRDAKVVIADYALLKRDFPFLSSKDESEIDEWLLLNGAYIARSQLSQTVVNTPILIGDRTRIAYRPLHYGRSLVFQVLNEIESEVVSGTPVTYLLDCKGSGSRAPTQQSHGNGLLTVGEGLKEYLYEKISDQIFEHYDQHLDARDKKFTPSQRYHTVGSYAVIDYGFDVITKDGTLIPAGLILRQAHDRYGDPEDQKNYNFLPAVTATEIELILRHYGVTSTAAAAIKSTDGVLDFADIQGTKDCAVLDFGTYICRRTFVNEFTTMVYPEGDGDDGISPDHELYTQPIEGVRLPEIHWLNVLEQSNISPRTIHGSFDYVYQMAHVAARHLRDKRLSRELFNSQIKQAFELIQTRWKTYHQFRQTP